MSADRKTARIALAALLDAQIATFQAVYDHQAIQFGGLSPVCTVHSSGTSFGGAALSADRTHLLTVTIYWKWTDASENGFDDLSAEVLDVLYANSTNAAWSSLAQDDGFSLTDYDEDADGNVYRYEQIRVLVW
jgi:hypothetical protein